MPSHYAPSREVDTLKSSPSCPPTMVKAFADCITPKRSLVLKVEASHLRNTATPRSLVPPEAPPWSRGKHHKLPCPHHHDDTKAAAQKKGGATRKSRSAWTGRGRPTQNRVGRTDTGQQQGWSPAATATSAATTANPRRPPASPAPPARPRAQLEAEPAGRSAPADRVKVHLGP
jgi:hypothetical protein